MHAPGRLRGVPVGRFVSMGMQVVSKVPENRTIVCANSKVMTGKNWCAKDGCLLARLWVREQPSLGSLALEPKQFLSAANRASKTTPQVLWRDKPRLLVIAMGKGRAQTPPGKTNDLQRKTGCATQLHQFREGKGEEVASAAVLRQLHKESVGKNDSRISGHRAQNSNKQSNQPTNLGMAHGLMHADTAAQTKIARD